jgi:DNA-binding NtrC family response regulator
MNTQLSLEPSSAVVDLRPELFRVLLVEPESEVRAVLQEATRSIAHVAAHNNFSTARASLLECRFDFVITNLRLGDYNGLHLVHIAAAHRLGVRTIVYSDRHEFGLAREAQRAGAFYERGECLPVTVRAYLSSRLPPDDRRDPSHDRRQSTRGGRRAWDVYMTGRSH